jgi:hypothetical protein
MEYDPISEVIDERLSITDQTMRQLKVLRAEPRFPNLPGVDTREEKERLSATLDPLFVRLIEGVENNPSKLWVMKQFQPALDAVRMEDTEAREHFAEHLHKIMDALNIESSDGLLGFYL